MIYANYHDVLDQLRSAGLIIEGELRLARGKRSERVRVEGEDREKRGWYRLYEWEMEPGVWMLVGSYGVWHGDDPGTRKIDLTKRCVNPRCGHEMSVRAKACPKCGASGAKKRVLTEEQMAALKARLEEDRKRAEAERRAEIERASVIAGAVWRACSPIDAGGHDYLKRKRLSGSGGARALTPEAVAAAPDLEAEDRKYLAQFVGAMVIPMCDPRGQVFGLQFILSRERHREIIERRDGRDKEYWPAGLSKEGKYFLIGPAPGSVLLLAEGFATAMSVHEATGLPVAVAFDAGNLAPVARSLYKHYKRRIRILVCADDDRLQKCRACGKLTPVVEERCAHCGNPHGKINAGVTRAAEAALAVEGAFVAPSFSASPPEGRKGPTDFNDLAVAEGIHVVRGQIEAKLEELGWLGQGNAAPAPSSPAEDARAAGGTSSGNGDGGGRRNGRRAAVSVLTLDEAVERFVPLDDGTGKFLFDHWTRRVVLKEQLIALLPPGVRFDDVKRHPVWSARGAYYIDQVGFDPAETDENIKLNTWRGWPMQPQQGNCQRLMELFEALCGEEPNSKELFHWLMCWMAYPLQHPGTKMSSAVILHGPQGTGKSTAFRALARIYGDGDPYRNYSVILDQRALESEFNSEWESKLFVLAEEVVNSSDKWALKNELKELVTGERIRIQRKFYDAYYQTNRCNIVFLSNEGQPLPIENDDRRHCVIWTPPPLGDQFYASVREEMANGGIAAFYYELLNYPLGDFRPWTRPPMTQAKRNLIHISLPSEEAFLRDWVEGRTEYPVCTCYTRHLYRAYCHWCRMAGEPRPRNERHFVSAIKRKPGWGVSERRVARAPGREINTPMVDLPAQAYNDAIARGEPDYRPRPGEKLSEWATRCFFQFEKSLPEER